MSFAAAISEHPLAAHAVGEVTGQVLDALGPAPDLAVLFVTAPHTGALEDIAAAVRRLLRPVCLIGCTASAVVAGERGVEGTPAVVLWAAQLGVDVTAVHLTAEPSDDGWVVSGMPLGEAALAATLVLLPDPYTFPTGELLARLSSDHPELTVIGGLASGALGPGGNRLVVDGDVVSHGAVGVLIGPTQDTSVVVSQGCRPIGQPFTVTRAERNILLELGGRPALERLMEIVEALPPEDQRLIGAGLHCGIVADEHKLDFERGDFLVRAVLGADRERSGVAIGDTVPVGATVQFQVRDASTAGEDLRVLLGHDLVEHGSADGVLLFTCTGRGAAMFGDAHHDALTIQEAAGPVALGGMFCAGELGPVAARSSIHGFTASLALFRDP